MNVSSIVIQTLPKYLEEVIENIKELEICDYHLHDDIGRIIVTIEGEGISEELKKLKVIQAVPHIISSDMQMAYSEDELDEQRNILENSDVIPHILQNDNLRPDEVIYNGDLKKKDLEGFARQFDQRIR